MSCCSTHNSNAAIAAYSKHTFQRSVRGGAEAREAGAWQKGKPREGEGGVITNTPTRQLAAAKKCEMQDTHNEIGRPKKVGNTK